MYKVLLAEDELLVRIGIKNSIDWSKLNMEIAAEVENGALALKKFELLKPDLIITDIRMPGMNGLELIQQIRKMDRRCAIIVISCMDDFKLLQDIMRFDVIGYILKATMSIPELLELLERARLRLNENLVFVHNTMKESQSKESLLIHYTINRNLDETAFLLAWNENKYERPAYQSITLFQVMTFDRKPVNEMGFSFIRSIIAEKLPESDIICIGTHIAAFHSEHMSCTDRRFAKITQMIQQFFEGTIDHVTQEIRGQLSDLPVELEELIRLCETGSFHADIVIQSAVNYILNHYQENLSLTEISEYVGLSPNYFSSIFKKETKVAFVNYLNEVRIERAKMLLQNTDWYLYQIAEGIGFNSVEHFSQTFKQKEELNPGEWRKKRRGSSCHTEEQKEI